MRAGSRVEHEQTAVNGIPKGLNYYVIFIVRTYFTNVVADRLTL